MGDEAFSLKNWASAIEARDRIAAELGIQWAAELRLMRHLCRGELVSGDVCFIPGKGFEETIERQPREYWQVGALTKLSFALSEHPKPKGWTFDPIPPEAGTETTIHLNRVCLTYIDRHQLDALYPPAEPQESADKDSDDIASTDSPPRRRRPGPPPTKDWKTVVARKVYDDLMDGDPVPTVSSLRDFCRIKIDHEPHVTSIRKYITELLRRLID